MTWDGCAASPARDVCEFTSHLVPEPLGLCEGSYKGAAPAEHAPNHMNQRDLHPEFCDPF
jgi:hypothetical protein